MTWENLAKDDYLAALIEKTGIKIDKTFIGTDDEQFAKLRAGGAVSYADGKGSAFAVIAAALVTTSTSYSSGRLQAVTS